MIRKVIEMPVPSLPNMRAHWAKIARIKKQQRQIVAAAFAGWSTRKEMPKPPCVVTLVRIGPRRLDGDNNVASMKAHRDQIADILGIDDADPRVEWRYDQRKGEPKQVGVEITIEGCE